MVLDRIHYTLNPTPHALSQQAVLSTNENSYVARVQDGDRFRELMQYAIAQSLHDRPMSDVMQAIGYQLLGSAYQSNLLDRSNQETLVVSLSQFDCVLFVETVLALARGIAVQDHSYRTFTAHLQDQRYRDGTLNGYCSRLHYFSEWISDNEKRGTIVNITAALGAFLFTNR